MTVVKINRAPVLTLWAAIVAERLGYDPDAALTLGKAVSGLNAQSKGQRLGIYEPAPEQEREKARRRQPEEQYTIGLLGRAVAVVDTPDGLRAVTRGRPENPDAARRYLEGKFGAELADAQSAMRDLAESFSPEELARRAFDLYEQFRPEIPEGKRGWGASGELDFEKIRALKPGR